MALFLGLIALLLLAQPALPKSVLPIGSFENYKTGLSNTILTQDVTIISDTTSSITNDEDAGELEILTKDGTWPVSYTHLTLPTILRV